MFYLYLFLLTNYHKKCHSATNLARKMLLTVFKDYQDHLCVGRQVRKKQDYLRSQVSQSSLCQLFRSVVTSNQPFTSLNQEGNDSDQMS